MAKILPGVHGRHRRGPTLDKILDKIRPVGPGRLYGDPPPEPAAVIGRGRPMGDTSAEVSGIIGRGRPMGTPGKEVTRIIGRGRPFDPSA